jgi:hypothetical protein
MSFARPSDNALMRLSELGLTLTVLLVFEEVRPADRSIPLELKPQFRRPTTEAETLRKYVASSW